MAKVIIRLANAAEQTRIAADLRLKKHAVVTGDPITAESDAKETVRELVEAKVDVAVVDYISDDALSVKMLQEITDSHKAPRFIFILPDTDVPPSHILMAVNEGASAILEQPVNTEALHNYIERAVSGPGRFRYELARDASAAQELSKIEKHSKTIQMQLASYRKLISFLMATPVANQHREVMVVSDSAYQRDYLRKVLEDHGFRVVTARNPEEGLETALAEKPRIVISDLEMEGKNGVEFCHDLKIAHKFMPCFFVICTANSEKIESVMAPGNGVDACVIKPSNEMDNIQLIAAAAMGLLL